MGNPNARRIWLTGASRGIGLALAEQLLMAGHKLALTARTLEPLETLDKRFPGQVLLAPGDVTDGQQVSSIGDRISQVWGALDCAIINAGTCEYIDSDHFDAALLERVVRTNLLASSYCVQEALLLLRLGKKPHLVGVCSSVTYLPRAGSEAYGASKAGMRYLFESLRLDLAHENIDVTIVSPGFVDMTTSIENNLSTPRLRWPVKKAASYIAERLQRPRRPIEIAFPGPFILTLRLLALLPTRIQLAFSKRIGRSGAPR